MERDIVHVARTVDDAEPVAELIGECQKARAHLFLQVGAEILE